MMNIEMLEATIQQQASEALRKAALNEEAKTYLLNNPLLFNLLLKAARRYIGGENLEEALLTRKKIQDKGFETSLEFMGESVSSITEAKEATREFLKIIEALKSEGQSSRVSLDLSHLGLFLDSKLGLENFRLLAKASENTLIDLFISAEGLERTDEIIETYIMLSKEFSNVHITLQAYLHRTKQDLEKILKMSRGKIRVVKGAYDGPKEQLLLRSPELNDRYIEIVETIFNAERYCSIATHDIQLLDRILVILSENKIKRSNYEFEMLYGICTDQLSNLQKEGHPCRQYVVYGKEWYLYLCNRIAENPENVFRALIDIIGTD